VRAAYLEKTPASKGLLPAVMQAAGLNRFPKSRYFEIAQHYQPGEVHPEVRKKLAQMKFAFGAGPAMDAAVAEAGNA
jgi:hypothetical protein